MGVKWESNFMKQYKHKKKPPKSPIDTTIMKCSTYSKLCLITGIQELKLPDIVQYGVGFVKVSSKDIELHIKLLLSIAIINVANAK